MIIEMSCVAEIADSLGFAETVEEYASYCNDMVESPKFDIDLYTRLEKGGAIYCYRAMEDEKLIGFMSIVNSVIPHWGKKISIVESLYVLKAARKSGAGIRFIRKAEEFGRNVGSWGVIVNCPVDGELVNVLPKLEYAPQTICFFKKL